ncbi:YggT family protein [Dickeya undicola]|uniref:YggT family protein n=1 Tax=Dickeya undicola TaxID=1577887 RepID=UPI003F27906C
MLTLTFLVSLIGLYVMVLLLRIWMQWARSDFYNPLAQFVVKLTQPIIGPLRRIIPSLGPIDSASLLLAFLLSMLKFSLLLMIQLGFLPSLSWINLLGGILALIKSAGYLVFWIVIIRSLMSWVSQGHSPVDYMLHQLTEPLMGPVRRVLPSAGGLDFSPMVVILLLYLLNYLGMDFFPGLWFLL